ncbi:M28 family peptidase [Sediminibacterium sp.]|uniref:M28 family metallopeptidase n=1 Tax=Sediminibacterium sp. TaxID=1917865 RepID=UPI0025FCD9AB|nr:M28 family peptidase [Sediminibacterium sp.]MBW0177540.1 M28 family peptidase [Sediminibacterium sp.]
MKKYLLSLTVFMVGAASAQNVEELISQKEVERIERTLSSDEMEGRRTFTKGIDKAAAFIADEFKKTGLQTWNNSGNFLQQFVMVRPKFISLTGSIGGVSLDSRDVVVVTCQPELNITEQSGYEKVKIAAGANLGTEARKYLNANKNYVVIVDTSFSKTFNTLTRLKSNIFKTDKNIVFILTATDPATYSVSAKHEITEMPLANVVGVLPGKSKKNEYVIFSGHYDHLGVMGKDRNGNVQADSIFNGANDDAAGTTAMMVLAQYFKKINNNERTLIFAAFTAEEVGGFGATYFSRQFDPKQVMAMFNIEMIGSESKWGKNSAFITGYEKTDMGKILQGNLAGTDFTFHPDPYPEQQLFYRSDNATLARLGVPAHTISTTKIDVDPYYHKASDEFSTIDIENMTRIIRAIALSSRGIVSGKETPTRVNTSDLR